MNMNPALGTRLFKGDELNLID